MKTKKLSDYHIAFVDCETTGLDTNQHEIIEIAALIYDPKSDQIIRKWSKKAAPRHIETAQPKALEMNGYKKASTTYIFNIQDIMKEFSEVVNGCIIAGQNIQFDINFIDKYNKEFGIKDNFNRHKKIEMISIEYLFLRNSDIKSLSLNSVCKYLGISNEGEHRALIDCERTLEVYKWAIKQIK